MEAALIEAEAWLVQNQPADFRDHLLTLYFRLHSFRRTAELYDERYVTIIENGPAVKMRLFCLDPSHLLREALTRGKAAIFFSATLTPLEYYCAVLGGMAEDPKLQLASPFPPANLAVLIHDRIQTQLKAVPNHSETWWPPSELWCRGEAAITSSIFPPINISTPCSRAFRFAIRLPVLVQRPGMTEPERDAFLAAFSIEHGETLVGFAVLGGIFGEGIDLVGERLIGAVIVGVGLPQLCVERDLIRDYFQQHNVSGFDYAYTFPGMNRVLQTIGRVIRSETDHGVVLLIDARFNEVRYRRLFPAWWKFVRVRHSSGLEEAIRDFWKRW